jgi:two-component system KDP operon response regulator KdpE
MDDEPEITDLLRLWLDRAGYQTLTAHSGGEALRHLYHQHPGLIILDIMMPQMDGWQVCQRIREVSDAPVMMLTARADTDDKVLALTLGADDYLTKPFEFPELLARVRALLRRSTLATSRSDAAVFEDGYLRVDFERRRVWVREQPVKLSPIEFRLLAYLVQQRGWIVTHDQLLDNVWGPHCVYDSSYVKLYIKYLRNKIEEVPSEPRYIRTEWGIGYYFDSAVSTDIGTEAEPVHAQSV